MNARDTAVRQPVFSGVHRAAGLWFDAERLSVEVRAQRLLASWRQGAQAFRFVDGDLLRFSAEAILHSAHAPGEVLCRIDGDRLCSAPLVREERAELGDADLILVRDAHIHGLCLREAVALDPSQWIPLDDFALHETLDFSDPPAIVQVESLDGKSARSVFDKHVPAAARERDALLRAFADAGNQGGGAASRGHRGSRGGSGVAGKLRGWIAGLATKAAESVHTPPQESSGPSRLRQALTRLALASRLSTLIGHQQSKYLQRMLRHFDNGDLREALRHAIPINGDGGSRGQSFSTPGRRDNLELDRRAPGGSYGIHVPLDLQQHLHRVYRQAFERLDREGRIDEAAFVLAELLNARQECLDYLERHGRTAQAAELALGWNMPSATSIRLLLLAGDWHRAVQMARRDNSFASLIPQLSQQHPALAARMRVAWGEALADRGEWLAAIDAVWPVTEARNLAAGWLSIAERGGETLSASALVRRAALLPETLEHHRERILALSDPDTTPDVRDAVAQALLTVDASSTALSEIALRILPALAADRAENRNLLGLTQFQRLLARAGDLALSADMPDWRMPSTTSPQCHWGNAQTSPPTVPAPGLMPIADVVPLPYQRYLVALGEAGLMVIDRRGRVLQRYTAPCHRIVIADNGAIALAVAGREQVVRVTRIDLDRRHANDLGTLVLQHFAPRFDGIGWSIVSDGRLLVLDTGKSLRDVLWHVGDLPGPVADSHYGATHELHLIGNQSDWELWSYHLPERRLISRNTVATSPDQHILLAPPARAIETLVRQLEDGTLIVEYLGSDAGSPQSVTFQPRTSPGITSFAAQFDYDPSLKQVRARLPIPDTRPPTRIDLSHTEHGLWLAATLADGRTAFAIFRHDDGLCMKQGLWPADAVLQMREYAEGVLVYDTSGRLLDLSPRRPASITLSLMP